ncbi:hypothetical protein [Shouchella patagoniensis]|uniref:hypothetical protein n=1 Tax=Shouchella patagoniensis TaxID=228576 RepID=UPI0009951589|nr:hypothetical protein [Shouchella patagoniensis]
MWKCLLVVSSILLLAGCASSNEDRVTIGDEAEAFDKYGENHVGGNDVFVYSNGDGIHVLEEENGIATHILLNMANDEDIETYEDAFEYTLQFVPDDFEWLEDDDEEGLMTFSDGELVVGVQVSETFDSAVVFYVEE